MASEDDPVRASRAGAEPADDLRERVSKGLIVTDEDDPVEAFAKKRISRILRERLGERSDGCKATADGLLFARLRSEPVEVFAPWRRDDLYARRRR